MQNLNYFNIEKWEDNIKNLETYDICGINYIKNPKFDPTKNLGKKGPLVPLRLKNLGYNNASHYKGNFWWANSCHIKKLKKPSDLVLDDNYRGHQRLIAEFWIGGNNPNAHEVQVGLGKFEF